MTDLIKIDASDLSRVGAALPRLGFATARLMVGAFTESGKDLRDTWKRNAKVTAGKHGKHYPDSIEANLKLSTDIVVEVAPNPNKPQGGMSFEFGSVNQPPHLDGQKGLDEVLPRLEQRVNEALAGIETAISSDTKLHEYTTKAGVTRQATSAQIANWTRGSKAI